jgi:predicted Zn-dependent peptidase
VESITKEFRDLKERQVSDEELRRPKDHLKGSLMLGLESTGSRMSNLARQEMYFGKFFPLDELLESIEVVTGGRRAADRAGVFPPEADRADDFGQSGEVQDRPGGLGC